MSECQSVSESEQGKGDMALAPAAPLSTVPLPSEFTLNLIPMMMIMMMEVVVVELVIFHFSETGETVT